jgi:hypothetical protein
MSRLSDVLSTDQYERLYDELYASNGNAIPVVDGIVIPGCTAVTDEPTEISLSAIRTDSRKPPAARLRYHPDNDYRLRLQVSTEQPDVLAALLGMGAQYMDQAAWNTAHVVGDPTAAPTAVDDALWGIFKVTGASLDTIAIDRLPHADFVGTTHGTDYFISVFDPTTTPACYAATGVTPGLGGTITWNDRHIGDIDITSIDIPATALSTYDPATSGLITLPPGATGVTVGIDFKDPNLAPGDDCVILGFAYAYSQLSGTSDWGITQPLTKPTRCIIDLYESLSDDPQGSIWERRRFYDCRQYKLPARSTDGSRNDATIVEYEFVVEYQDWRLGGDMRYYDRMVLVD